MALRSSHKMSLNFSNNTLSYSMNLVICLSFYDCNYMLCHKFTDEMRRHVRENLTLISGVSGPMKLADYRDGRVLINRNSIALLKQLLTERGIEVLDHLVGCSIVAVGCCCAEFAACSLAVVRCRPYARSHSAARRGRMPLHDGRPGPGSIGGSHSGRDEQGRRRRSQTAA